MKKYSRQVSFGFDPSGKRIRRRFQADTIRELNEKIDRFREDLRKASNPSDISFMDYSERWLTVHKGNRAKQTQDMYAYALKKCRKIDPYPVNKITKTMCQDVVNGSWEHPSAAHNLVLTLKQIFKAAIADGIIYQNPAENLSEPKRPESRFHLLSEEDLQKIAGADLNESDRLFVTIMQVFGPRPAEVLALQVKDFDFDTKTLHICKALEMANDNSSAVKETKTGVSREIPIPDAIIPFLSERIRGKSGSFLFQRKDGGLYTKSAYRRLSERVAKASGIEQLNFYDFRHRRATDLYYLSQKGKLSTKRAAYLMGHSEAVFLKTYSHIDDSLESDSDLYPNLCHFCATL